MQSRCCPIIGHLRCLTGSRRWNAATPASSACVISCSLCATFSRFVCAVPGRLSDIPRVRRAAALSFRIKKLQKYRRACICILLFSPTFQRWMKKKVGSDATDEKRFQKENKKGEAERKEGFGRAPKPASRLSPLAPQSLFFSLLNYFVLAPFSGLDGYRFEPRRLGTKPQDVSYLSAEGMVGKEKE